MKRIIGATAFSIERALSGPEGAKEVIAEAKANGIDHLQWLVAPDMSDEYFKAIATESGNAGMGVSALCATFHPVCPCGNEQDALAAMTIIAHKAAILFGGKPGVVAGPAFFRGLGNAGGGLQDAGDRQKQIDFLGKIGQVYRTLGIVGAGEVLNRFESPGPNTVKDAITILGDAKVLNVIGLHVDTFHSTMSEASVADAWGSVVGAVRAIHVSAFGRQGIVGRDSAMTSGIKHALETYSTLRDLPLVIEAFGSDTPAGFYSPLAVREVSAKTSMQLFAEGAAWLRRFFD